MIITSWKASFGEFFKDWVSFFESLLICSNRKGSAIPQKLPLGMPIYMALINGPVKGF